MVASVHTTERPAHFPKARPESFVAKKPGVARGPEERECQAGQPSCVFIWQQVATYQGSSGFAEFAEASAGSVRLENY